MRAILLALLITGAEAGGGGDWGDFSDYASLFCWVILILIASTILIDEIVHWLKHKLEHLAEVHHEAKNHVFTVYGMHLQLFERLQSELMVLGFLAFGVFVFNWSEAFDAMVDSWTDGESGSSSSSTDDAHDSGSGECCACADDHRRSRLLGSAEPADFFETQTKCGEWRLPSQGAQLLHVVESAHMCIFITMVIYFIIVGIALTFLARDLERLSKSEADKKEGIEPKTAAEIRRRKRLDGVRHLVLEFCKKYPEDFPGEEVQRKIQSGDFDVSMFLSRTVEQSVQQLITFPVSTWLCIFVLYLALALFLTFSCLDAFHTWFVCNYVTWFITIHALIKAFVADKMLRAEFTFLDEPRNPVPFPLYSRLVSPFILFTNGNVPWDDMPSENLALTGIQTVLFISTLQLVFVILDYTGSPLHRAGNEDEEHAFYLHLSFLSLVLVVWAVFLLRYSVMMFLLPPFISNRDGTTLYKLLNGDFEEKKRTRKRTLSTAVHYHKFQWIVRASAMRATTTNANGEQSDMAAPTESQDFEASIAKWRARSHEASKEATDPVATAEA